MCVSVSVCQCVCVSVCLNVRHLSGMDLEKVEHDDVHEKGQVEEEELELPERHQPVQEPPVKDLLPVTGLIYGDYFDVLGASSAFLLLR